MKFLTQMRLDGVVLGEIVDISRAAALQACQNVGGISLRCGR